MMNCWAMRSIVRLATAAERCEPPGTHSAMPSPAPNHVGTSAPSNSSRRCASMSASSFKRGKGVDEPEEPWP